MANTNEIPVLTIIDEASQLTDINGILVWISAHPTITLVGVLIFISLIMSIFGGGKGKKHRFPYRPKHFSDNNIQNYQDVTYSQLPIFSPTEHNFFLLLTRALLNAYSDNSRHLRTAYQHYNTTRIDFVLFDKNFKALCLIELDDQSHDQKQDKDIERDFITKQAGYKTIRFDCRRWPTVDIIRNKILGTA
jgi:very-short-patch-repair endonuclease